MKFKSRLPLYRALIGYEFFELIIYLFIAAFLIYSVNVTLTRVLFLLFLPIIWQSKRDYLWLAFLFIILEQPGGLFSGGLRDDLLRLPLYSLGPRLSISFHELVILLFLFKSLAGKSNYHRHFKFHFRNEVKLLIYLFLALLFISPIMGIGIRNIIAVVRLTVSLTLIYSLPRLINSKQQLIGFLKIIFPFVFIALILQIYGLINGEQLIAVFKPGVVSVQGSYSGIGGSDVWVRPIEMGHVMLVVFTGSLWLLTKNGMEFGRSYLLLLNLLSFLVVFLSGTRSWVIAFVIGYLFYFRFLGYKVSKIIMRAIVVIVLFAIISTVPIINKQIQNSWSRVSTVEKIAEGDITAGGTISRYDIRAPRVMEGFLKSSILFGAGFSNIFFQYADGHVGYHNILLNTGILGALIFLYVVIRILKYPIAVIRRHRNFNVTFLKVSRIPLIIMLIINTGTQMIGYTPDGVIRIVLMAFALIIIDVSIKMEYFRTHGNPNIRRHPL